MRRFAKVMDTYMLDPILGMVLPGVGDVLGSLLGFYVVVIAMKKGVSPIVIARMVINILIDAVIGIVPLVGDLADFAWKSNTKNLQLLEDRHITGEGTWADWALVLAAVAALVGTIVLVGMLVARVLEKLHW